MGRLSDAKRLSEASGKFLGALLHVPSWKAPNEISSGVCIPNYLAKSSFVFHIEAVFDRENLTTLEFLLFRLGFSNASGKEYSRRR